MPFSCSTIPGCCQISEPKDVKCEGARVCLVRLGTTTMAFGARYKTEPHTFGLGIHACCK